ncbi:cellulase family glycosylhydrolase [Pseudoroseomonas sp. WGS1072]|uniref:cellulase family glycosylhydrolase n=1 Tax=Roseomonas sp. WGS1072 TaxID=3366816 RepID=UPI003BF2F116
MSLDIPFGRRALLAAAVTRPTSLPCFLADEGIIRGISTIPPQMNWEAASYGLTSRRVAALHSAGFNTLRLFLPLQPFLEAASVRTALTSFVEPWLDYIARGTSLGFRVLVSWGSTYEERLEILQKAFVAQRFHHVLAAVSSGLASRFSPQQVALEIMNEPPEDAELRRLGFAPWSGSFAPALADTVRLHAPDLTIVVQSASGGWAEAIPDFDPERFDTNTMLCFHFYTPGEFTHQGAHYPNLYDIPFPITRYPGGKAKMHVDVDARIRADPHLSLEERRAQLERHRILLDYLWYAPAPLGPSWVTWPKLDAWIAKHRINPLRLLCGEFGVVSHFNFNGSRGCDVNSRARYLKAVRLAVENRGFGGWVAHQAMGDFNLMEQTSVSQHGEALIPEITAALFG